MTENDAVMNAETRRALRQRGRQIGMVVVGAAVAIALFGVAGLAAILSIPWQLALALTVGVVVALPLAMPYAMLRVLGLSHRDVLYVGKQAYREVVAEVIALSGTRQTADVFTKNAVNSPPENADESSPESVGNGSLTPDGGEAKNEGESGESAEKTENSNADEAAESATGTDTASQ